MLGCGDRPLLGDSLDLPVFAGKAPILGKAGAFGMGDLTGLNSGRTALLTQPLPHLRGNAGQSTYVFNIPRDKSFRSRCADRLRENFSSARAKQV